MATVLVKADLRGQSSHGILRLPIIVERRNRLRRCTRVSRRCARVSRPRTHSPRRQIESELARIIAVLEQVAYLQAVGVDEADVPAMAAQAIGIERLIRLNPRPVTVDDLEAILRDASQWEELATNEGGRK